MKHARAVFFSALFAAILISIGISHSLYAASPIPVGRWINFPLSSIGSPPLPNAAVITTVAVDEDGNLWLGTNGYGIATYDGYTWQRFTTSDGLVNDSIERITVIGSSIWIATIDGVSTYVQSTDTWTNYTAAETSPNGLNSDFVRAIAYLPPASGPSLPVHTYLFGTQSNGISSCQLLAPAGLSCTYYTTSNTSGGLVSNFIYDIDIAANGDMWVAGGGVSKRTRSGTWTSYEFPADAPGCPKIADATDIAIDDEHNRIWITLSAGLFDIDGRPGSGACMYDIALDKWYSFTTDNSGLMDDTVRDIGVDSEGRAWMATATFKSSGSSGVHVCTWVDAAAPDPDTCYWESYFSGDGLSSNSVQAVATALDRVWFGTANAGISSFALRWGKEDDVATSLAALPDMIYAGTTSALKRLDYGTGSWTTVLPDIDVTAILALADDDIWLATADDGLRHWNGTNWTTIKARQNRLAEDNLLSLAQDSQGRLWIGTANEGVSVFDPVADAWVSFNATNVLPSDRVQALVSDNLGGLWVGTDNGLIHYTGSDWQPVDASSLPAQDIRALSLDAAGNLWVGTPSGAARHVDGVWTTFTTGNSGLAGNNVKVIVPGQGDDLWLGTAKGTSRWANDEWFSYRRVNSGLSSENIQALAIDDEGNLWASSDAYQREGVNVPGAILFRYNSDEPLGNPAPTITDFTPSNAKAGEVVTINGNYLTPDTVIELPVKNGTVLPTIEARTASSIRFIVPAQAVYGSIRLRNATGTATSAANFSPLPNITSISVDSGIIGSLVTVHGTNLASPGFTEVRFGDGAFNSLILESQQYHAVTVRVPADATDGPIRVRTPAGTATSDTDFTVSTAGLVIFGHEVHQGLPQYPRVAGKSTVVRVFVGTEGECAYVDRGVLQTLRQGDSTPRSYIADTNNGGIPSSGEFCNTQQDVSKAGSIDFVIPGEDIEADVLYNMGFGLSIGFINLLTRDIGGYRFSATDDVRIHASIPAYINDQTQADALDQTMTTQYRTYPVRDGWGMMGDPTGMQLAITDYPLCDGTETAYCGAGYEWDFWQQNPSGQLRACTIENQLANGIDDGDKIVFTINDVPGGKVDNRFIYARLRTGQTMPADPLSLIQVSSSPGSLAVTPSVQTTLPTQRCGNTTFSGVVRYRLRFENTTNASVNAVLTVDYDQNVIDLYGAGGIMAGSGNNFSAMLFPGQYWYGGGWLPSRHDAPADENYSGQIDSSDLTNYMFEGQYWDTATGRFVLTTDPTRIKPGDLIRNFGDTNNNNQHDSGEPTSPHVQKGANGQTLLWDIPFAYMTDYNKQAAIKADFSGLLFMPGVNPFMGPGQGGNYRFWSNVEDTSVFAQEVGHSLGLVDKNSPNRNAGTHSVNERINYVPAGYDTVGRRVVLGPDMLSIMWGISQSPGWRTFFEPFEYQQLYWYLRNANQAQASVASTHAGKVFFMAGTVVDDHDITLNHSFVATDLTPTSADPLSEYLLRFMTGDSIAGEHRFQVDFDRFDEDHHDEIVAAPAGVFAVIAPYPDGTTAVEIWHDTERIYTRTVSAASPTVQVLSPNGGETIGADAPLTVEWQASDADSDTLHFAVRYSPDAGTTWQTLGAALLGNSFTISATSLPGSDNGLIQVEATDGFNTANDQSDGAFSVGDKPPLGVSILSPANDATIIYGTPVYLSAVALDLEDGLLEGNQFSWQSDLDGTLGAGNNITALLTVGIHQISLVATDSDENDVQAAIRLTVDNDFDGDGLGDTYETSISGLEWWDATDAGEDFDDDGLTNRAEAEYGTKPNVSDSDNDGVSDGEEARAGTSPTDGTQKPVPLQLLSSRATLNYEVVVDGERIFDTLFLMSSRNSEELEWTVTESLPWLSITPNNGTTTSEAEIRVDANGLAPGIYLGNVTISAPGVPDRNISAMLSVVTAPSTELSGVYFYLPTLFQ